MRTFIIILISGLLKTTATPSIHQNDIDEAERYSAMSYTIEVRNVPTLNSKVVGRFTDAVWDLLWKELQISDQQWDDWHSSQVNTPLLTELPEISKLAYIDEGVVHFRPKELNDECVRLLPRLGGEATRDLVELLQEASDRALKDGNSEVVVHPFPA